MVNARPPAFVRPEHAENLAMLRVALCAIILLSPQVQEGVALSAMAPALRLAPEGLAWATEHVPITPVLARIAQLGLVAGAFSGLVVRVGDRDRDSASTRV